MILVWINVFSGFKLPLLYINCRWSTQPVENLPGYLLRLLVLVADQLPVQLERCGTCFDGPANHELHHAARLDLSSHRGRI